MQVDYSLKGKLALYLHEPFRHNGIDSSWAKGRFVLNIVVVMWLCCFVSGCKSPQRTATITQPTPSPVVASPADEQAAALRELRVIGKKIVTAVLAKDGGALLPFDRDDLRLQDKASIKDKNTNLYWYLFDSTCISGTKIPSVYEKLSKAQKPEVYASVTKSPDGRLYGLLIFYDKSQLSEKQLNADFVCTDKALNTISSWHFVLSGGKWNAITPSFDMETDALCSD